LRFPIVKLIDYEDQWDTLDGSDNPFAVVIMAHLKTRHQPEQRLQWKFHLVKRLYTIGYSREDILELYRFIDWLLALPDELEHDFRQQLMHYEDAMSTPYITSIERSAIKKGMEKGQEQGLAAERKLLYRLVYRRFGEPGAEQIAELLKQIDDLDRRVDYRMRYSRRIVGPILGLSEEIYDSNHTIQL